MKTTAEKIAVMQAYEEGKKIRIEFDFGTMVTFCSGYIGMCVWVDDAILYLGVVPIDYKELADNWLIWTGTLNEWLPCTKTVNN